MFNTTNQLNKYQLKDIETLKDLCQKVDGSVPNLYNHILTQRRVFPASILYYEEEQLMGFLSAFFFYAEAVEVALLVHPSARRRGVAKQLIQAIIPLIQTHHFNTIIFTSPAHLNSPWLPSLGFAYLHSEYYMERGDLHPLLDYNQSLTFRTASATDIPVLCALDEACFPESEAEPVDRFAHMLDDRNYQILIAFQNNHPIGKAHFRWENRGATLSDISILPTLQGKGLGSALISHCINYALSEGKPHLNLDVETHNERALNLYKRLGFIIQNACDYWTIDLSSLSVHR